MKLSLHDFTMLASVYVLATLTFVWKNWLG